MFSKQRQEIRYQLLTRQLGRYRPLGYGLPVLGKHHFKRQRAIGRLNNLGVCHRNLTFMSGAPLCSQASWVSYHSGVLDRCGALVTSPAIRCRFNLWLMSAAPSLLMQTRRTPPCGRRSIAEIPTFSSRQRNTISPSSSATNSTRLIAPRPAWRPQSRRERYCIESRASETCLLARAWCLGGRVRYHQSVFRCWSRRVSFWLLVISRSLAQASRVNSPRVRVELLGESVKRNLASGGSRPFGQAAVGRGLFTKILGGFFPWDRRGHVAISRAWRKATAIRAA